MGEAVVLGGGGRTSLLGGVLGLGIVLGFKAHEFLEVIVEAGQREGTVGNEGVEVWIIGKGTVDGGVVGNVVSAERHERPEDLLVERNTVRAITAGNDQLGGGVEDVLAPKNLERRGGVREEIRTGDDLIAGFGEVWTCGYPSREGEDVVAGLGGKDDG